MDFFYTGYYTGYKIFRDDSKEAMKFYEKDEEAFGELLENEYIIIEDENHKVVDCYKYKNEVLVQFHFQHRNPIRFCPALHTVASIACIAFDRSRFVTEELG